MKIGVVYGHVSKNIGDLALNCGTVQLILNTVPYADVHVVFLNPKQNCLDAAKASFEGLKNVTFTSFHTRNLKKSRDITFNELSKAMTYVLEPKRFITDAGLNGCDLLLYNGGEHLFTYKDRENPISNIDLTWRVLPALVAKSVGMRFIILPVTVGPLEVPIVTQMISSFFHLSDGAAIREPRSAVFTAKLLDGNPLPALLDPAFFMPIPQRRIYNNEPTIDIIMRLEDIGLRIGIKNTRIALEKYRHNGFTSSRSFQFIIAVARSFFQEIGGKVNLVVQSSSADHALADAVTQVLTKEGYGNKVQLVQPTSLSEYQEEISRANFIVSSRLHTCILGLLLGKACLGVYFVEHGHKIPGVFEMLGLPDYCLNLSKDSPESLAVSIIPLYVKRKHAFAEVPKRLQSKQADTIQWLKQAIRSKKNITSLKDTLNQALVYLKNIETMRAYAVSAIEKELSHLKTERDTLAAKLDTRNKKYEQLKANWTALETRLGDRNKEFEKFTADKETLVIKLESRNNKFEQLIAEREALVNKLDTRNKKCEQLRAEKEALVAKLDTTNKKCEQLITNCNTLETKLDDKNKTLEKLQTEREILAVKLDTTVDQQLCLKSDIETKRIEINILRNSFSYKLGCTIIQAINKPGKNTILLPFNLVNLVYLSIRRSKKPKNSQQASN